MYKNIFELVLAEKHIHIHYTIALMKCPFQIYTKCQISTKNGEKYPSLTGGWDKSLR